MFIKWAIILLLLILGFLVMNYSVTADPQNTHSRGQTDSSLQNTYITPPSPLALKEAVILGEAISEEWPTN